MHRRTFGILLLLCLVLLAGTSEAAARRRRVRKPPTPTPPRPEQVIARYCALDLQGARLSPAASGSQEIRTLMTSLKETDWNSAEVTESCVAGKPQVAGNVAYVPVTYSTLGQIADDGTLTKQKATTAVKFTLRKVGTEWKIEKPALPPHPSAVALSAFWQGMAHYSSDPERRARAPQVLAELQPWTGFGLKPATARVPAATIEASEAASAASEEEVQEMEDSFTSTVEEFAAALRSGDAGKVLTYISTDGLAFSRDGTPIPREALQREFSAQSGAYCVFFDTACLRRQSGLADARSFRDLLGDAHAVLHRDVGSEDEAWWGHLELRLSTSDQQRTMQYFDFRYDQDRWELAVASPD